MQFFSHHDQKTFVCVVDVTCNYWSVWKAYEKFPLYIITLLSPTNRFPSTLQQTGIFFRIFLNNYTLHKTILSGLNDRFNCLFVWHACSRASNDWFFTVLQTMEYQAMGMRHESTSCQIIKPVTRHDNPCRPSHYTDMGPTCHTTWQPTLSHYADKGPTCH